ncbi:hypothetical protein [Bradyrhizobium sp.]|uniref:hypothetical protein n=1 Tax=Bradyrhizobium sp. TaxID=376 RepID=UPI0026056935|nr:hypothetical protein [Bradyrhizobium sp.]
MFEAIIFLIGAVERTALRAAPLGHNAALNVLTIESAILALSAVVPRCSGRKLREPRNDNKGLVFSPHLFGRRKQCLQKL